MSSSTRSAGTESFEAGFVASREASRSGAHRARPGVLVGALPVVGVVAVVAVVALIGYVLLGSGGGDQTAGTAPNSASRSGGVATAAPSDPATQPDPTASGDTAASPLPGVGGSASPNAGAAVQKVNKKLPLQVLNATRPAVNGLAKRVGVTLKGSGYNVTDTGTWTGTATTKTIIYYGGSTMQATAKAVAKALKVGTPKLSTTQAPKGIVVVLASDYQG